MKKLHQDPAIHLTTGRGKWCVISHGQPLCADTDRNTAEKFAAQFKINLPDVIWNGDRGEWVHADSFDAEAIK
jgi:hypothetical protein